MAETSLSSARRSTPSGMRTAPPGPHHLAAVAPHHPSEKLDGRRRPGRRGSSAAPPEAPSAARATGARPAEPAPSSGAPGSPSGSASGTGWTSPGGAAEGSSAATTTGARLGGRDTPPATNLSSDGRSLAPALDRRTGAPDGGTAGAETPWPAPAFGTGGFPTPPAPRQPDQQRHHPVQGERHHISAPANRLLQALVEERLKHHSARHPVPKCGQPEPAPQTPQRCIRRSRGPHGPVGLPAPQLLHGLGPHLRLGIGVLETFDQGAHLWVVVEARQGGSSTASRRVRPSASRARMSSSGPRGRDPRGGRIADHPRPQLGEVPGAWITSRAAVTTSWVRPSARPSFGRSRVSAAARCSAETCRSSTVRVAAAMASGVRERPPPREAWMVAASCSSRTNRWPRSDLRRRDGRCAGRRRGRAPGRGGGARGDSHPQQLHLPLEPGHPLFDLLDIGNGRPAAGVGLARR